MGGRGFPEVRDQRNARKPGSSYTLRAKHTGGPFERALVLGGAEPSSSSSAWTEDVRAAPPSVQASMQTWLLVLLSQGVAQSPAIDLERAAYVFGEAEEAALADDGKLWGHSLLGPILFADTRTRQAVANQPDEEGRLGEEAGVFVGTIPEDVSIANTGIDWAGVRWTMVMWPLPEERFARVQLLLHESYHRIQPRLAHGLEGALPLHLDSEDGRTWLRLELRALAEALDGPEERRAGALADALCFRARRRALSPAQLPDARATESALERNEGLAEYTGLRLCGLDERARAARAAQRLRGEDEGKSFVRSFAYVTGPAYGLLHAGRTPP